MNKIRYIIFIIMFFVAMHFKDYTGAFIAMTGLLLLQAIDEQAEEDED